MFPKQFILASQTSSRRAAIRDELLPSHLPLPKPTRDISASNRSQYIIHQQNPPVFSDRRILNRQNEEFQYEKQANILYTKQFKSLGKLLGNQTMEFDELKQKIEALTLKTTTNHTQIDLRQKIQMLERELVRKEQQRSSQLAVNNNEYLKEMMETNMTRTNKFITELSGSIKKQDFEEIFRSLENQVKTKNQALVNLQKEIEENRHRHESQIVGLEEELIKRNQTILKITHQMDSLSRKLQSSLDDVERGKRRQKDQLLKIESQTRANYQGITYSINSLLLQLQTRDQQFLLQQTDKENLQNDKIILQQQIESLKITNQRQTLQLIQTNQQKQLLEKYASTITIMQQRLQGNVLLQEEVTVLKLKIEEQNRQLLSIDSYIQKIHEFQLEIDHYSKKEGEFKRLLDEATERESHLEAENSNKITQIGQLSAEIQILKEQRLKQRSQLSREIENRSDQLQQEKNVNNELVQKQTQLQQIILEAQQKIKNLEMEYQQLADELHINKKTHAVQNQKLNQVETNLLEERRVWQDAKNLMESSIEQLQMKITQQQVTLNGVIQNIRKEHQKELSQMQQIVMKNKYDLQILEQDKSELQSKILELHSQKQQLTNRLTSGNDLQNITFNYCINDSQHAHVNDTPSNNRDEVEELRKQVDRLNDEVRVKNNQLLTYSKSINEENSLRLMVCSLEEEKEKMAKQYLQILQRQKMKVLNEHYSQKDRVFIEKESHFDRELQMLKELLNQERNKKDFLRVQAISNQDQLKKQIKQLQSLNYNFTQQLKQLQNQLKTVQNVQKAMTESFNEDGKNYKEKERRWHEENSALAAEIQALNKQIQNYRNQCDQLRKAYTELQLRNNELEKCNKELKEVGAKVQKEKEEQDKNLSKLSRKSNVSEVKEGKKEDQYFQSPEIHGQLSRNILNYDPSKISGQQSKFAFLQNSKINIDRDPMQHPETPLEIQIKQQKNEESALSKSPQQKQKSRESSPKIRKDHFSEASRKSIPQENTLIRKDLPENFIFNQTISNKSNPSVSNSLHSEKRQNKNIDLIHTNSLPGSLEQINKISNVTFPVENQPKRNQYLPQQSIKKIVTQSNEQKELLPSQEEQIYSESFQKKMNVGPFPPIYVARPTIMENQQQGRDNSTSKSNSKKKITITYGQPSDRSIQIKNNKNTIYEHNPKHGLHENSSRKDIYENRSQASKGSSRVFSITPLINPSPHQMSPLNLKRSSIQQFSNQPNSPRMQLPIKLQQSFFNNSYLPPPEKIKSQSIINRINHNSRNSLIGNNKQLITDNGLVANKESSPSYVPPKLDNVYSPRQSNAIFNMTKSPTNINYTGSMASSTYKPTPAFQLTNPQIKKRQPYMDKNYNRQPQQSYQMRVNMKKLSNGRRMNSGVTDSLTFGDRSVRPESDSLSMSSDSGIEVMQYDWTAPCCQNQP